MITLTTPVVGPFKTWADLLDEISANNGVCRVSMETLRQLEGAQRLGPKVLDDIHDRLTTLGFGYLPDELPNRGTEFVILYRYGTPAADTVQAIRDGLSGKSAGDSTYAALRNLNSARSPESVVPVEDLREKAREAAAAVLDMLPESEKDSVRRRV